MHRDMQFYSKKDCQNLKWKERKVLLFLQKDTHFKLLRK